MLYLPGRILLKRGPPARLEIINVQIVQLPSYVMNAPEYIQLPLVVTHRVAVSHSRHLPLLLQPRKFIITQTQTPDVVESCTLALSPKHVNAGIVTGNCTPNTGTGNS
jgi:hypothetical protein